MYTEVLKNRLTNICTGWTAFACGFFEWVIPYAVQVDSESATITVGGSGQKIYPFTLQYDVGRALAETFKNPAKYKDSWILLANNWLSLDDIAVHIQQQSQGKWTIRHIDLDDRTPVLKLFEESDENVFDRSQQTNLPIELCDIKDQVKVP